MTTYHPGFDLCYHSRLNYKPYIYSGMCEYNVHMYLIDVYVCVPYELKLRKFREDKRVGYIEQGRKH